MAQKQGQCLKSQYFSSLKAFSESYYFYYDDMSTQQTFLFAKLSANPIFKYRLHSFLLSVGGSREKRLSTAATEERERIPRRTSLFNIQFTAKIPSEEPKKIFLPPPLRIGN
jgi:hypothetical protein